MSENLFETVEDTQDKTQHISNEKKYLTFLSDGLYFGVNVEYVIEIITNHKITILPMVPNFIKGIINLRGQVIPILDIRLRMNKPSIESTDQTCIIVLNIDSVMIGIFVDSVSQVVDIDESQISPPTANNRQELVNGMISLSNEKVVLLLDCQLLISNQ